MPTRGSGNRDVHDERFHFRATGDYVPASAGTAASAGSPVDSDGTMAAESSLINYVVPGPERFLAGRRPKHMTKAHRLDCEAAAVADCRFVVQSEDEVEAIELAKRHMNDVHGQEYTDEELRTEHFQVV